MRGADIIIKMRRAGFRPHSVFLWDVDVPIHNPRWEEDFIRMEVCTHGDMIGSLDLRFLVGLSVTVYGDDIARVKAMATQCRKVGAQAVLVQCKERCAYWDAKESKWQSF